MRRTPAVLAAGLALLVIGAGARPDAQALGQAAAGVSPVVAEGFFDEVRERLAEADRLDDAYFYRERRTEIHTNPFGRLGTGDVSVYEVYPSTVRGLTYRRLVEENGVPVPATELAEQDREYHERAAEVRAERAEEAAAQARETLEERAERERREAVEFEEARERAREQIDDVVNAMQFAVVGREVFEGRPAILVTFGPASDADPETRRGDMARKFEGRAWIDEEAREVVYVEATSVDSISFGLGLAARISDGAEATLRRTRVADGVWMPTRITLTGRGRAMLFLRGLTINYEVEWADYQPIERVPVPGAPPAGER
jgi:hypothetical protein